MVSSINLIDTDGNNKNLNHLFSSMPLEVSVKNSSEEDQIVHNKDDGSGRPPLPIIKPL